MATAKTKREQELWDLAEKAAASDKLRDALATERTQWSTERAQWFAERVELHAQIQKAQHRLDALGWALVLAQDVCRQRETALRKQGDSLALAG